MEPLCIVSARSSATFPNISNVGAVVEVGEAVPREAGHLDLERLVPARPPLGRCRSRGTAGPVQFSMTIPASPLEWAAPDRLVDLVGTPSQSRRSSWSRDPRTSRHLGGQSCTSGVPRLLSVPGSISPCRREAMKKAPGSGVQIFASFDWFLIWFSSLAT